jgi:hypothetical protein
VHIHRLAAILGHDVFYFFIFYVTLFAAPKRYANALSLAFRPARLPSIIPPNAAADFGLIVGCLD